MKVKLVMMLIVTMLAVSVQASGVVDVHAHDDWDAAEMDHIVWRKGKPEPGKIDEEPPEFKGGPERDQRVVDPVPLTTLQLQYPDTVFLHGPMTENKIALTFDDGPDPRFTPEILDVLNEYQVPATFFLLGARAEAYPDLTTRIVNEGHIVGNHTFWHPDLVAEGEVDVLIREVERTEALLEPLIGYQTTLFRPPYGFLYEELVEELEQLGYSVIGWSVDALDWQELSPDEIADNVRMGIHPGAIVLMHDGTDAEGDQTETIEAIRQLIPELQEQGYEFVTVPELMNIPYQR